MIELKNSRETYRGRWDGRDHHALDCSIGAIQMREEGADWEDIKPRLVRDGNKLVSKDTPYRAEFGEDGSRLIFPDRTDLSKYVALPTVPLFQQATRIALADRITMADPNTNMHFILTNTGVKFQSLIKLPTFERITFDIDSAGLDILELLKARSSVGIPRPRLIDADGEQRFLEWSYKNGQLELGFDLTGLRFPVLLRNTTIDIQVGASLNDGYSAPSEYSNSSDTARVGYFGKSFNIWARFTGITIPSGQQIDAGCHYDEYVNSLVGTAANRLTKVCADDSAAPAAPTSEADHNAKTRTPAENNVDWDAVDATTRQASPDIQGLIAYLYAQHGAYSNGEIQILHDDDSSVDASWLIRTFDYFAGSGDAPWIYILFSAAAGGLSIPVAMRSYRNLREN